MTMQHRLTKLERQAVPPRGPVLAVLPEALLDQPVALEGWMAEQRQAAPQGAPLLFVRTGVARGD